jgi:hypothetical protein
LLYIVLKGVDDDMTSGCSVTRSEGAKNWPEGIISVKMTMNPYLLAMAFEEALEDGMQLWELLNIALWEKLGCPDRESLMKFAADMEIFEEDPKWKKRLKITAAHEVAVAEYRKQMEQESSSHPRDTEIN